MSLFPKLAASHPENEAYAALVDVGPAMYGSALVAGLLLWGLGIWWMFHAIVIVSTHYMTSDIVFNVSFYVSRIKIRNDLPWLQMGAWGVTFPLGSLALLTFSLGNSFDAMFFKYATISFRCRLRWSFAHHRVVGSAMTFTVFMMWWLVALPTARGFLHGTLFDAPCLTSLPEVYRKSILEQQDSEAKTSR